jgi:hypothetical protein
MCIRRVRLGSRLENGVIVRLFCLNIVIVLMTVVLIPSGCSNKHESFLPKIEVSDYCERTAKIEHALELNLASDFSNIEVYTWDRKEVKFEITRRLRDSEDREVLEKRLADLSIDVEQQENKITFRSEYKGTIKGKNDKNLDLRLFLPQKIRVMNYRIGSGSIKFLDDIKCELNILSKSADIKMNKFSGKLDIEGEIGNVELAGGKIRNNSEIKEKVGNINVNAELEERGTFSFETDVGNVDLVLPKDSDVQVESIGNIAVNDFTYNLLSPKVMVKSNLGKVTIRKDNK